MRHVRVFRRSASAVVLTFSLLVLTPAPAQAHDDTRRWYTNGCTMSPDQIPRLINMYDLCNAHDIAYARFRDGHHEFGSSEWGRYVADNNFLNSMHNRCTWSYAWWDARRAACYGTANLYYNAVRVAGWGFYYDNNTRY